MDRITTEHLSPLLINSCAEQRPDDIQIRIGARKQSELVGMIRIQLPASVKHQPGRMPALGFCVDLFQIRYAPGLFVLALWQCG